MESEAKMKEKRRHSYNIMGVYRGNAEVIDNCDTEPEARRLAGEYRMAFGTAWRVWVKSVFEAPEDDYKPNEVIAY